MVRRAGKPGILIHDSTLFRIAANANFVISWFRLQLRKQEAAWSVQDSFYKLGELNIQGDGNKVRSVNIIIGLHVSLHTHTYAHIRTKKKTP